MKHITTTLKFFAILMILVGVIYPVAVTALAQLFFPKPLRIFHIIPSLPEAQISDPQIRF